MQELKHITAWVKEQYAESYLLTWLLSQPGLWWCDGEIYEAALLKDGDRLKALIQKHEQSELLTGITEKLARDESWDALASSLTRIFEVYQEELTKLQDARRKREILQRRQGGNHKNSGDGWSREVSKPLPQPHADPLTGIDG
ncbi:hypothetical protein [Oxynema aestuarii]|jgi:hypothetical protein|uniref:Uncharacterized protein n=1 Tax=Oxynema aestuarii AP17 TaxID=2064643 RepID=A0A6H1TWK3_9CYAN|nr:hypothetical protein [Oxynema aestuarii]QIZ70586.1 hypothetical protein HCG48_08340 [Oxynema aestuarii AP17]